MRKHLSFVLPFLAKRYRIRLSDSKERIVLTEQSLNDFLEESFQLMSQAKKCISCENCANDRTKREGKNYSRTKRLLQFISKAIQIDWDGNGLLNRSKNSNRRRKRKRIMKIFEPITLAILLLFLVIFIIILSMLCHGAIISFRNGTAFGGTNAAITEQSEQRDRKCLNAFKGISPVVLDRQKGDEHHEGEEDEQLDCAICLGPIDYGTEVRPLPVCKHKFHDECIELWIRGGHNACPFCRQEIFNLQMTSPTLFPQHRQNNDGTNEATLIEITNGGGTEENEEGRREEEEGRRTTTAEGGEIDQVVITVLKKEERIAADKLRHYELDPTQGIRIRERKKTYRENDLATRNLVEGFGAIENPNDDEILGHFRSLQYRLMRNDFENWATQMVIYSVFTFRWPLGKAL
ncbi:hypothetical protein niasHT_019504 [Heterodera trifolii]|uniref:RING-type domain-containing protein n=1 Tax=Heterodera trifolii TaxID=157864 RepID=A0ABD2KW03_9BILA